MVLGFFKLPITPHFLLFFLSLLSCFHPSSVFRAQFILDKQGVQIETSYDNDERKQETTSSAVVSVVGNAGDSRMFKFKITNKGDSAVRLESCTHFLMHDTQSIVLSDAGQVSSCKSTQTIPANCEY